MRLRSCAAVVLIFVCSLLVLTPVLAAEDAEPRPDARPEKAAAQPSSTALKPVSDNERAAAEKTSKTGKEEPQEEKRITLTAGWDGSHPYIKTTDGKFLMKFGGRMQLDYRGYAGDDAPVNGFFLRRARLEVEGNLLTHFEYKVQADFADTGGRKLRDAFLNINANPAFQVKMGHFKEPFSQEELQSSKYIDFVERSSINNLVPGRSPGVMLHGKTRNGFEYAFGLFNGNGVLTDADTDRPEMALRLRYNVKISGGSLGIGGAATNGESNFDKSTAGRTSSRSFIFFPQVVVNGDQQRYNTEFWWTRGPFSLRGEYIQTNQFREGMGGSGTNAPGVTSRGYLAQVTWLLTGENKNQKNIKPDRAFLDGQGGTGAWELAFRFDKLQVDDKVNPNHASAYTVGVNWWLNKFVRYQANVAFERFNDPSRSPEPGDTDHVAFLNRIQVIF